MSNMREKIENICDEYFGLSPTDVWDERVKKAASASLLSLFQSEMTQIIGEDEDDTSYARMEDGHYPRETEVKSCNALRAEQRKKLKERMEG